MITKILKIIIFSSIILAILSWLPWISWLEIEPRTDFLFSVFSGDIFPLFFGIFLTALFLLIIVKWKGWISIIPLLLIAFVFYFNLLLSLFLGRTVIWDDIAFYKQLNGDNLIIVQNYWFGITGDSPRYRAIMTKQSSLHENIRPIKFLHDSITPNCLSANPWSFSEDSLPKEINLFDGKYILITK